MKEEFIKVKVKTGAKEDSIEENSHGFLVSVREKPERGMANKQVLALLRQHFGSRIILKLVRGQRTPSKIFSVVRK